VAYFGRKQRLRLRRRVPAASVGGMEPHYRLRPPNTIERIDDNPSPVALPIPYVVDDWSPLQTWGYHGSGPMATAATLLLDACGNAIPGELQVAAQELVGELLASVPDDGGVIGVRELRAWVTNRLPSRIQARAKQPTFMSAAQLGSAVAQALQVPRVQWFEDYRAKHGDVDIVP
jgi:hypothetical protein